jgi:hypothetical protein
VKISNRLWLTFLMQDEKPGFGDLFVKHFLKGRDFRVPNFRDIAISDHLNLRSEGGDTFLPAKPNRLDHLILEEILKTFLPA